jgi:GT2 family glycosyltransferase
MTSPLLSIIILSFNTSQITVDCLKSILRDKGLSFSKNTDRTGSIIPSEIIIIDNASSDNSPQIINNYLSSTKADPDRYTLITNRQNLGFSKANNQGIKAAKGNYLLFLNSDTVILHSAISQSLTWLSSHPEAAVCTAQLLNRDKTIQPSGGYFPNLTNVFTWSLGIDDLPFINSIIPPIHPHPPQFYTHDSFFLKDHRQDWVTGAFLLTRAPLINQINGFDEDYFMYAEELELSYRLHKAFPNLETWYLVGPQVIHLGGASATSRLNPIVNEYHGIIHFFDKHHPGFQSLLAACFLRVNARLRSIIYLFLGKRELSSFYLQACSKI